MTKEKVKEPKKPKKPKEGATVLNGEKDENGKLKTPHTKYGILSNIKFVMGTLWEYKRIVVLYMIVGAITQPCMQYIWGFFTKFILDIVQRQQEIGDKSLNALIRMIIIIIITDLALRLINTSIFNRNWPGYIEARFKLIHKRIDKVLSMDYETLEQPHILDMAMKAEQATGGNNNGVEGLMHDIDNISRVIVTMVVSFAMITVLDWRLILALIVIGIINYLSSRRAMLYDRKNVWDVMPPYWRQQNYMDRCTQDFDFAKDIRLFNMRDWLHEKQHASFSTWLGLYMKGRHVWWQHSTICSITGMIQGALMYFVLTRAVLSPIDPLTIGNFTLYISLCGAFSSALSNFLSQLGGIERNSMQVDDFRTLMDFESGKRTGYRLEKNGQGYSLYEDTSVVNQNGKRRNARAGKGLPKPESNMNSAKRQSFLEAQKLFEKGEMHFEFKNVFYKYEGADDYALKNLSLSFKWGERLAVVGLNGAGKTTFIKLLLRLYDVSEGEILLNGLNVKEYNKEDYFSLFSPVFQNVEIFAFPLADNVSMLPDDKTDKELVYDSLVKGGMKDKVDSLPAGVDTQLLKIIYDDGIDFSGGEKQKLALARALYKDAPVIVLDEPTAALDALAEYELYKNFDSIIGSKSALYISHRLSSTRFCDNVAMFAHGELVEYGTHEALMAKNGEYAKMFEVQAQYYEEHGGDAEDSEEVVNNEQ